MRDKAWATASLKPLPALIASGIYRIRNTVNGRSYTGQAVDFYDRWRKHRRDLNKGSHHSPHLQHAWVRYGETAFAFEIIETIERNKKALDSREQVYLDDAFASGMAYNTSSRLSWRGPLACASCP